MFLFPNWDITVYTLLSCLFHLTFYREHFIMALSILLKCHWFNAFLISGHSDPAFPFISKSLMKIVHINMYIYYFLKFIEELFDYSVNILRYFDTYSQNNFQKCYHLLSQLTNIYWAFTMCLILYRGSDYNGEYCSQGPCPQAPRGRQITNKKMKRITLLVVLWRKLWLIDPTLVRMVKESFSGRSHLIWNLKHQKKIAVMKVEGSPLGRGEWQEMKLRGGR